MQPLAFLLPVFGVVMTGYVLTRRGVFSDQDIDGILNFVQKLAVPFLLFISFATQTLPTVTPWPLLIGYYVPALVVFGMGTAIGVMMFNRPLASGLVAGASGGFSNTALVGIPLILAVVGEQASFPMFFILTMHGSLYLAFVFVTVEMARFVGSFSWRRMVRTLVYNPILIGVFAGIAVNLIAGPITAQSVVLYFDLVASSTAGCALFGMGATLTRYRIAGDIWCALVITVLKIIVFPLLVWYVMAVWFDRSALEVLVAVMLAGLPSGISPWVAAVRNGMTGQLPGTVLLMSTLGSAVTLSFVLVALG
ncbi:MAG: AEC family transporter [Alphaproteobacteria bacterium]|nr:AEC family transporter [Alphaproteobacteria bacterium]